MSFTDYCDVDDLTLAKHITIQTDDGAYVTGRVVALKLLDDEEPVNGHYKHRITLLLDNGTTLMFDRDPDEWVILEGVR